MTAASSPPRRAGIGAPAAPSRARSAAAPEGRPSFAVSRRRLRVAAIALGATLALAWGLPRWWFGRTHETTDDAQVDGHVLPVSSRIAGYVVRIPVADNQHVHAGDTIAVIDPGQAALGLDRARAREAIAASDANRIARAAVREARARLAAATARVDAARAEATRAAAALARVRSLAAAGVAPADELERATEAFRKARAAARGTEATRRAMQADVDKLEGEAAAAAGRLAVSRSDVADAALQLGYTVVTAPASGWVTKRAVERGQLVAPGQPLMALVQDDEMWVAANFKETQLDRIAIGAPVTFTVDAYGDREFRGHVRSIQPGTGARFALLPPDNASGNFTRVVQRVPVLISIDRASVGAYVLRPGLSAVVAVDTRRAESSQSGDVFAGRPNPSGPIGEP
ncbi:MAG TPA: HlyD family secretion protein [Gemmatimonadaceae bacterium]